jgi:hypothetical protein
MFMFPLGDASAAGVEAKPVSGGVGEPGAERGAVSGCGLVDRLRQLRWEGNGSLVALSHAEESSTGGRTGGCRATGSTAATKAAVKESGCVERDTRC